MAQNIPLTVLPRALAEAGYPPRNYRACYEAARSAQIPAKREGNGRWTFNPRDIGEIADRLNLSAPTAAQ